MSYLQNRDFLKQLDKHRNKEIYARAIALTFDENPIEKIEGLITTGSINLDGDSAVRRTCSLSLVAEELNINDYYWGLKSKFKLEIGLKNVVGAPYENLDIIWFPQGVYAISTFNTSYSTSGYNISISGKDKMCFLNGDLGGNLTASIDFGTEEYYDKKTNTTIYSNVPIETIVREGVHTYANEPYYNIVVNDLDDISVELLEYKGDIPLYLLRNIKTDQFVNFTDNGDTLINFAEEEKKEEEYFFLQDLEEHNGNFDQRVELNAENSLTPSKIVFKNGGDTIYTVAKLEHGQTAGYRYTDLIYAGSLISTIGESFTSILDKIVAMLGEFEYFYDLDGRFIFQKKKTYIQVSWNDIVKVEDDIASYQFENITSFSNTPNLSNLKNDYSIWGEREAISGTKVPIHYRYAIDQKPTHYKSFDGCFYYTKDYAGSLPINRRQDDWRELIYQMALDYYQHHEEDSYESQLRENNPETCFKGMTGYEQYYADIQGFWRQLYNPKPEKLFAAYENSGEKVESFSEESPLRIKGRYAKIESPNRNNYENIWALIQCNGRYELHPWIDVVYLPNYYEENNSRYYRMGAEGKYYQITNKEITKSELYYLQGDSEPTEIIDSNSPIKPIILKDSDLFNQYYNEVSKKAEAIIGYYQFQEEDYYFGINKVMGYDEEGNEILLSDQDSEYRYCGLEISKCYYNGGQYYTYLQQSQLDKDGKIIESKRNDPIKYEIKYYYPYYNYITNEADSWYNWTNDIIDNPTSLNFWFDFMNGLDEFAVSAVGDRTKVVNDNKVTSIYFREVPSLIFTTRTEWEKFDQKDSGYTPVFVNSSLENLFKISSQGKSAQDKLNELLYSNTYCIESVTIQSIPVYYLQPNTRILVRDDNTKINGEYLISKISLSLTYNGTMSITATKAPEGVKI